MATLNPKVLSSPQGQQSTISVAKPQPTPSLTIAKPISTPQVKVNPSLPQPTLSVTSNPIQPQITSVGTTSQQQSFTPLESGQLSPENRTKLNDVVHRMTLDNRQPEEIQTAVDQFKQKYGFGQKPEQKNSFLGNLAKSIVSPFARLGKTAEYLSSSKSLGGEGAGQTPARIDTGGFKPIKNLKDAAGVALELGSYAVGGEGATGLAEAGLKGAIKQGAIQGLKTGVLSGALSGAGSGLQQEKANIGNVALNALGGAATGGLFGAILGGAGGAAGKLLPANRIISAQQKVAKATQDLDTLAGKIVQGSTEDIAKAKSALSNIDISSIKSYKDFYGVLDDQISAIAGKLDQAAETHPGSIPLENLSITQKAGNKTVNHNYVQDALTQLEELYSKTNDPVAQTTIQQALEKAQTEGLTAREVNDLARTYGQEFNAKAFSKISGDPLTSVNAQAFENTRTGVKKTFRNLFNNPVMNAADEELSNLIRTRDLVKNVGEKVNQLKQKIEARGLGQKAGRLLGQVIDRFTGGTLKGFLTSFIPRGEGLKVMNAIDLENALSKNLKVIQSLLEKDLPEETIIQKLEQIVNQPSSKIGGLLESPAMRMPGGYQTKPNLGTSMRVTSGPTKQSLLNTKMLPSGNGQGETIFQGTSDKSNSKILDAERFVYRDPKTGQMRRGYKISSKP